MVEVLEAADFGLQANNELIEKIEKVKDYKKNVFLVFYTFSI